MLILELETQYLDHEQTRAVTSEGCVRLAGMPPYALGFVLWIPADEWRFLGEPRKVQFVASGDRLGVRAGWIEGRRS